MFQNFESKKKINSPSPSTQNNDHSVLKEAL